jgi:hypothetical protein
MTFRVADHAGSGAVKTAIETRFCRLGGGDHPAPDVCQGLFRSTQFNRLARGGTRCPVSSVFYPWTATGLVGKWKRPLA